MAHTQGLIRGAKDAALTVALRKLVNSRLHAVGEVTELSLNSANRSAELRLHLCGEAEPMEIRLSDFEVQLCDDGATVIVGRAAASREWLSAALSEFVVNRSIHISRNAARLLQLLAL